MEKLVPEGLYGVVMTPFKEDGRLDVELLRQEFDYCNNTNTAGLLLCGSTSEFVYLKLEQAKCVFQLGKECVIKDKILIGGAGGANERQVMERLNFLADIGYTYAIVCPPYYYPQKTEDIYDFYQYIAVQAPSELKLLLYNIPFCTPKVPLELLPRLMEFENIVGLKDSSGDMLYFTKAISMARELRPEFSIFTGQDCTLLPSLSVGGNGCMSALAWMLNDFDIRIIEAFENNEKEQAQELQLQMTRLVRLLDRISFPENYRALAEVMGIAMGPFQRSFQGLDSQELNCWKTEVRNMLEHMQTKAKKNKRRKLA